MKGIETVAIRDVAGGAVISVKAVPGSSRDRVAGVLGECLKVATSAPAEKGKANQAIAAILAKALNVASRQVTLASGPTNPRKEFHVAGLSSQQVRQVLADM